MISSSLDRFSNPAPRSEKASRAPTLSVVHSLPDASPKSMQSASEATEALVLAARRGDPRAEEALYTRFAPDVFRVVCRLLGSRDEAADVMQDTFVTVFEDLRTLREPAAFRGWVLQIAVRLVYRRFRRRKLTRFLGLDRSAQEEGLENLAQVDAGAEARAELRLIDAALRKLDSEDRIAWLLRHVEGFELLQIGEMMRCSLATAKRKLSRAEHAIAVFRADTAEGA